MTLLAVINNVQAEFKVKVMETAGFNRKDTSISNVLFFSAEQYSNGHCRRCESATQIKYTHQQQAHELHGFEPHHDQIIAELSAVTPLQRILSWGNEYLAKNEQEQSLHVNRVSYNIFEGKRVVISELVTEKWAKVTTKAGAESFELEFSNEGPVRFKTVLANKDLEFSILGGPMPCSYSMKIYSNAGYLDAVKQSDSVNFNELLASAVTYKDQKAQPYETGKFIRRYLADAVSLYFGTGFFEQLERAANLYTSCERAVGRQLA